MLFTFIAVLLFSVWVGAWLTHSAMSRMVDEINARSEDLRINHAFWWAGKYQQVVSEHRRIAPASKLRERYRLGSTIGLVGTAIAVFGFLITSVANLGTK